MPHSASSTRRRPEVVIAIDDALLSAWLAFAARASGLRAVVVTEPAVLFETLARRTPAALILADGLGSVPAEALVAMLRTTGSTTPALLVGPFDPGVVRVATRALQPLALLADPMDGAALVAALRELMLGRPAATAVARQPGVKYVE